MAILRFLFLFICGWVVVKIINNWRYAKPTAHPARPLKLVCCEVCGIYLPQDEAVKKENHIYCAKHAVPNRQ
jgi:hypothetical protein